MASTAGRKPPNHAANATAQKYNVKGIAVGPITGVSAARISVIATTARMAAPYLKSHGLCQAWGSGW